MIADVFTKGLNPEKFVRLRRLCGMQPPNNSSASEKECWENPLLINCVIVVSYMTFGQNLLELWFCSVFKVITFLMLLVSFLLVI